jgi:hypothetical protein
VLRIRNAAATVYEYVTTAHDHSGTTNGPKLAQANSHESPDTDSATSALHHTIGGTANTAAAGNHTHAGVGPDAGISFVIDGGGAAITTGAKGDVEVPWSGTVTAHRIKANQSGDIVVDVLKATYANFPSSAATIWGGSKPTLSGAATEETTGLSIAVSKGDWLRYNVDSAATCQRVTLALTITRS